MGSETTDFRYNTGDTKVPWAAVGEDYNATDLMEIVKFLMQGEGKEHDAAVAEVDAAVRRLSAISVPPGKLSLAGKVEELEKAIDSYLGVEAGSSLFVTNCTSAFEIAYRYAGIGPGDEVIVPSITFIATMAYPLGAGAKLVFADIDPRTLNMDPADVARKITPKTKMIVPVHIGGYPVDMDPIMELANRRGIIVLEDAAHGFGGEYKGRKLGTIGHFGAYSFHEVKNCTSFGEGGVLVTNIPEFRSEARRARFLGVDFSNKIKNWLYDVSCIKGKYGPFMSANTSVTEIQALGLLQQMKRYDKILAERRREATYMTERLSGNPAIVPQDLGNADIVPTFHLYQLQIVPEKAGGDVQTLKRKLDEKGVTNIPHFGPLYRFAAVKQMGLDPDAAAKSCPVCERVFDRCFTHLPIYGLTEEQLKYMADSILESVKEMQEGR